MNRTTGEGGGFRFLDAFSDYQDTKIQAVKIGDHPLTSDLLEPCQLRRPLLLRNPAELVRKDVVLASNV